MNKPFLCGFTHGSLLQYRGDRMCKGPGLALQQFSNKISNSKQCKIKVQSKPCSHDAANYFHSLADVWYSLINTCNFRTKYWFHVGILIIHGMILYILRNHQAQTPFANINSARLSSGIPIIQTLWSRNFLVILAH